jgi:hypothetical protein
MFMNKTRDMKRSDVTIPSQEQQTVRFNGTSGGI